MTEPPASPRTHWARFDPDARGGLRLTLAVAGALTLAVPFALLLLLVVDRWTPLRRADYGLAARLNAYAGPRPAYVTFLKVVTTVGHPAVFEAAAVAVAVWLLRRRRPRVAAWLAVTVFGGGMLSTVVKNAVGRQRPLLSHPVAHAASASFPSGHALGSVVGIGALLFVFLPDARAARRPVWFGLGVLVVLAVRFSRLGLGLHYLSDVLGGYILGLAWLAVTTAAFTAWHRDQAESGPGAELAAGPAAPEQPG